MTKNLTNKMLNTKERQVNKTLKTNKKWGIKFYLMRLIPFEEIEAVGHLCYKLSVCEERVNDESKESYHNKVKYMFDDAPRATFEAITENRNHFYTEYIKRYNSINEKSELETHRVNEHYDLDIFILTACEHKLVHHKQILLTSPYKNEGLLYEIYDTQAELLKAHGITEATYLKALANKKDNKIIINKKEYELRYIDNSDILTYAEQREQLLRHKEINETQLQRYDTQFPPLYGTKEQTLKQLKKIEAELAELDKLIRADERHNKKWKSLKGLMSLNCGIKRQMN